MIRVDRLTADVILGGAQGFVAASFINNVYRQPVVSPLNGVITGITFTLLERVTRAIVDFFSPSSSSWKGPIPTGLSNIVSYSFAISTTAKILEVAKILRGPPNLDEYILVIAFSAFAVGSWISG